MRKVVKLDEKAVVRQIRDYMEYRGWRYFRTGVVAGPGYSIGEPGCADSQFIYYDTDKTERATCLLIWCEFKSPDDKRKCNCAIGKICKVCRQRQWQERERQRGAVVIQTDSFVEFATWYERHYGYLHSGYVARGQLDLLTGVR